MWDESLDAQYFTAAVLVAPCVRCHAIFTADPHTVVSVWVNNETQCPLRPDATRIVPGEPGTTREPLCDTCVPIMNAGIGRVLPVYLLFPNARIERIHPRI